ncbi:FGGY family carbohydrate kinase [Paenibacillus sp. CC-CFT747]|nr:FGGY family carbohydrate kinase [Paenibacillus sp. CC-CFT747]
MSLLGIDIGTTHCKAGVFREDGKAVRIASRPTRTRQDGLGRYFYDPGELWETAAACIREVLKEGTQDVQSIGIASMAESGLLVDSRTGTAKTAFLPWFDSRSMDQAERIGKEADPYERFRITGLRSSYKYGLAKLLWLKEQDPDILNHAVWLSASDYAAYRLTGTMATDYSLAGRTFAFDINKREWDSSWIRHFGLNPDLFPAALPAGSRLGCVHSGASAETGLPPGTPVAIAGHDHVCAALAVGAVREGDVYVSAGTAETLVGILPDSELSQREYDSGLSYGLHAVQGQRFWMGGISASGGSVEWLRGLLGDDGLSYQELMGLLESGREEPTGILYFPYLSGSGAPGRTRVQERLSWG